MQLKLDGLSKGELFIVKWQYSVLGGFLTALAECIERADNDNLAKLRIGFPAEVDSFRMFRDNPNWWGEIQERIGAKLPEEGTDNGISKTKSE